MQFCSSTRKVGLKVAEAGAAGAGTGGGGMLGGRDGARTGEIDGRATKPTLQWFCIRNAVIVVWDRARQEQGRGLLGVEMVRVQVTMTAELCAFRN